MTNAVNTASKWFACLLAIATLGACQSQPTKETMVHKLSHEEAMAVLVGNTAVDVDGKWHAFYGEDGRKIVVVGTDKAERRWWKNSRGEFCQTLYRDGAQTCDTEVRTEDKKTYKTERATFKMVSGNPYKH
ncbi:MAG: hypothetical protein K0U93_24655 [Gammaproteobacteria bacterium]|nr:hypothetical protein [Gammaproteobacteria bacterium]